MKRSCVRIYHRKHAFGVKKKNEPHQGKESSHETDSSTRFFAFRRNYTANQIVMTSETADTLGPQRPYEVFEHTADIGLHAFGRTLPELFIHAAQGMESLMVAPEEVRVRVGREITVTGHDEVSLLITWLNELIVLFDTEYLLLCQFEIDDMTGTYLKGRAYGERYDAQRHDLGSAIKAATWHEATVELTDEGYKARIIFDI